MKNATKTLNAKEVKQALIAEGVKVISCKKATGSLADCVNLVISSKDLSWSMSIMSGLNIVDKRGFEYNQKYYQTSKDYVQFFDCKQIDF